MKKDKSLRALLFSLYRSIVPIVPFHFSKWNDLATYPQEIVPRRFSLYAGDAHVGCRRHDQRG
jgi:hypothetical protein